MKPKNGQKKSKTNPKGAGRPHIKIDPLQVEKLAMIQCTQDEMSAVLGCSVDTLHRNYADVIKKGWEEGKMSLRRLQYKSAEAGDRTLLIWLGKQYLGQRDKTELSGDQDKPISIIFKGVKKLP